TVDESHERKLFYYLVTSERNPLKDPVVLWLNGGPGCSSFDGFVYEHGPFNFQKANKSGALPRLHLNPHSWSRVSNIIYLDSPAGVGFSYSKLQDDYKTGDFKTASESHNFLLKWFEQYPEFLSSPFYLAGESFAGVYVPTLASEVAKGIIAGLKPILNFKGYIIGNGVTDEVIDCNAFVPFEHGMGLISDDLYEETVKTCKGNPSYGVCGDLLQKIEDDLSSLNLYDILEPCYHSPSAGKIADGNITLPYSFKHLGETERPLAVRKRMFGRAWPFRAPVRDGLVLTWPQILNRSSVPCFDDRVATEWLNNAAVRKAIHAEQDSVIGAWVLCKGLTYYLDAGSMIKYHKNLTAFGYRALIYRYTQGYAKNLTFLTIKGSGHTVPKYKPVEALAFYSRWLEGHSI
ncbi:serine carboxypeptidase 1-like, partial [Macadamia integrifolia]|uniref:serine carboxypeptidase 1-like n=1 Tax=Macadamia integrifolia TaxID=60698 RepID=UPI001C530F8B